jgi:CRP-like cAMP-binding protein
MQTASFGVGNTIIQGARSSELREAFVGKPAKNEFDPKAFLARLGAGKAILNIKKNQHVFEQGDVADTIFYVQKGRSSSLSYPSRARKR